MLRRVEVTRVWWVPAGRWTFRRTAMQHARWTVWLGFEGNKSSQHIPQKRCFILKMRFRSWWHFYFSKRKRVLPKFLEAHRRSSATWMSRIGRRKWMLFTMCSTPRWARSLGCGTYHPMTKGTQMKPKAINVNLNGSHLWNESLDPIETRNPPSNILTLSTSKKFGAFFFQKQICLVVTPRWGCCPPGQWETLRRLETLHRCFDPCLGTPKSWLGRWLRWKILGARDMSL